ncbi:Arabinose metabolism transcriptional repressor [Streptomyces sp. YIM 130001]|uniref:GntR family transcriptional regulator n=1 Tax=Streptomyces sp. YIM 130001 TaxID=2259644 RepID=UPI000E65D946|nr:GntR family transcriptional regulator [Streptomyces sp. YIM 130001]RII15954.1 Arabinose metabolism transcriptional repressor [Streptomyces sp. YIM 130001]
MKSAEEKDSFLQGPKYLHVAKRLRANVENGLWAPGTQLPVERELADTLAVSVNTLRRAVGQLVAEGIVQRRQGAGTFVAPEPAPPAEPESAPTGRRLVGVLVPSTTYYYPRVVEGIQRVLRDAGVGVVLASSKYELDVEQDELQAMRDSGVQGLLFVPNLHLMSDPQGYVDGLRELPLPYVLVERRPPAPEPDDPTSWVGTDHAGGVCLAVRHLRGLGHRRIGHLGRLRTGTAEHVARGFDDAAALLGVDVVDGAVAHREVWGAAEITAYVRHCAEAGVTAVFCHGDRDAAALVVEARRQGLAVPRDFAVVAYDDEVAEVGDVPLTAVSPPKSEVGALAAQLLLGLLDSGGDAPSHRVEIQPRLVVRASCGAGRGVASSSRTAAIRV